jgi:hypothetical protein
MIIIRQPFVSNGRSNRGKHRGSSWRLSSRRPTLVSMEDSRPLWSAARRRACGVRSNDLEYEVAEPPWWQPFAWLAGLTGCVAATFIAIGGPSLLAAAWAFTSVCWLVGITSFPRRAFLGPRRFMIPSRPWMSAKYSWLRHVHAQGEIVRIEYANVLGAAGFSVRPVHLLQLLNDFEAGVTADQGVEFAERVFRPGRSGSH